MSVTSAVPNQQGASASASAVDPSIGTIGYRITYTVKCSSVNDGPNTVLRYFKTHSNLPYFGRQWKQGSDRDSSVTCQQLDVNYVENSEGMWIVVASYSQPPLNEPETGNQSNPTFKYPKLPRDEISVVRNPISIPVEVARFNGFFGAAGGTISPGQISVPRNSALVPYDPPVETELHIKIIRITKYFLDSGDEEMDRFNNTVNAGVVVINKPQYRFRTTVRQYCGKMQCSSDLVHEENFSYWKRSVEVHVNPLTWRRQIPDSGFAELYRVGDVNRDNVTITANHIWAGKNFGLSTITDDTKAPIATPSNLNGQGKLLALGSSPVYGSWTVTPEISWGGIRW